MESNDNPMNYMPQQMPITSDELYASQINEDKLKNILSQISPSNQVEDIEMRIRGFKKNVYTGDWQPISEHSTDKIPEEMIGRYVSWLSSFMNINTTLGNLSSHQITKIMSNAVEWVVDDIDSHANEYGIGSDFSERTRIGDILLNSTFLVLNRSLNGIEARRFWSSLSMAESSSWNPQQQNKSDWWKFWKK
jgi:hypothetical protein